MKQVGVAEIVLLPKVGHGFSVPHNWLSQFKRAFTSLVAKYGSVRGPEGVEVKDLPLVEVRAGTDSLNTMAVIISGDGGCASIDREIGNTLADNGISVVGFNSLQYFWKRRNPEIAAGDMERIIKHYLTAWNKERALIIGYSLGADVLPFMVNRLSPKTLARIQMAVLLGPGYEVDFEFHFADWLDISQSKTTLPVLPEVENLKDKKIKILCFYGEADENPLCKKLDANLAKVIPLKGGHHFGGDYKAIAETILKEMRQ